MTDCLIGDRVDFVAVMAHAGFSLRAYLTPATLRELYNRAVNPPSRPLAPCYSSFSRSVSLIEGPLRALCGLADLLQGYAEAGDQTGGRQRPTGRNPLAALHVPVRSGPRFGRGQKVAVQNGGCQALLGRATGVFGRARRVVPLVDSLRKTSLARLLPRPMPRAPRSGGGECGHLGPACSDAFVPDGSASLRQDFSGEGQDSRRRPLV